MKLTNEQRLRLKFAIDAINDCVDENREVEIDFYKRAIGNLQQVISELEPKKKLRLKKLHTVIAEQQMVWSGSFFEPSPNYVAVFITQPMFYQFGNLVVDSSDFDNGKVTIKGCDYQHCWFEEV